MKRVVSAILLIIVTVALILVNLLSTYSKKEVKEESTTTTTTRPTELAKDTKYDSISVEGEKQEIVVKKYSTHFGYHFYYEEDLFVTSLLSNGSIQIASVADPSSYVLIEKLNEDDYYFQYELLNGKEEIIDYYLSIYSFYRGNNIYLKVTKCIKSDSDLAEGLNTRLNYIINSIAFN